MEIEINEGDEEVRGENLLQSDGFCDCRNAS